MKTKIGMIGYFASGKSKSGGQEAKTCAIAEELDKDFGVAEVKKVDTLNWKKHPVKLFCSWWIWRAIVKMLSCYLLIKA